MDIDLSSSATVPQQVHRPDLAEVRTGRVGVMEHVPRAVLQEWSLALTSLCEASLSSAALPSADLLTCFPKCTLFPLARTGIRHKAQVSAKMRARLDLWAAGQLSDLWTAAPRLTAAQASAIDSRTSAMDDDGVAEDSVDALSDDIIDPRVLQRCRKALREGALSKAASALRNASVATLTPDVMAKLH